MNNKERNQWSLCTSHSDWVTVTEGAVTVHTYDKKQYKHALTKYEREMENSCLLQYHHAGI